MKPSYLIMFLVICLSFVSVAFGASIPVANGSFEDAGVPFGEFDTLGWDSIYGLWTDDLDGSPNPGDFTDNEGSVSMEGCGRDLGVTVSADTAYTVTYDFMLSYADEEGGNNVTSTVTFYTRDANGIRTDHGSVSNSHAPEAYTWRLDNIASFSFYSGAPGVGEELGIWLSYSGVNPWGGFDYIRLDSAAATPPTTPLFRVQPAPVTAALGSNVQFSIMAVNADSYAWKKRGSPAVLSATTTLSLTGITLGDEGYYYCEATNTNGTTISKSARLLTNRLMGHWGFEGNLNDSVEGKNGSYVDYSGTPGTAIYDTGIVGTQALDLIADPNHVEIPDPNDFAFYPQGITTTLWAKTTATNWAAMVSNYVWEKGRGIAIGGTISTWANLLGLNYGVIQSYDVDSYDTDTSDGQWHFKALTYDPNSGLLKVYVDGTVAGEVAVTAVEVSATDEPLIFGANPADGWDNPYAGLLDDVKIYNYALSSQEIADAYLAVNPSGEVCVDFPENDINGDCQINMIEFVSFANVWLWDANVP